MIVLSKEQEFSEEDINQCKKYYLPIFNALKEEKFYHIDHPYSGTVEVFSGTNKE